MEKLKNIPALRFPLFKGEWERKKAFDLFKSHSNKKHNGDLPILAITQDKGAVLRDDLDMKIISSEASVKSYKIVEVGDFIISLRSFQGGIEYSNVMGICSPAYTILKPKIEICNDFFKEYLKKDDFIQRLNGTVVGIRDGKQISYDAFSTLQLTIPSVAEQTRIASFLASVDEKLTQLKQKKLLLVRYKKGVMQKIFSQEIRFKNENGKDFPEWEICCFGDYFIERNEVSTEEIPLYSLTIENGIVPKSERYERSFLVNDSNDAYKTMHYNDFAFNPMNLRFGALARHKENKKVSVSKYYNIFYCNEKANSVFFEYYLTSYNLIQFYNKMATGSLLEKKRVHYLDFIHFKKQLPSLAEQNKIANFLSAIDDKINLCNTQIEKTEQWKKGLLQKMFC